jgi:hypothetical protein
MLGPALPDRRFRQLAVPGMEKSSADPTVIRSEALKA